MYGWHKRTFVELTRLLRTLESDPGDTTTLLNLQRQLVICLRRAERRIVTLKLQRTGLQRKKKNHLDRSAAKLVKRQIQATDEKLQFERALLFLFRCFGDGIAFIYVDAFALKHVFYNTHDYTAKQSAGAMTGKKGFQREWKLLRHLATIGPPTVGPVPAVLCDLTNTIRHGDVCVLIGPDPYLIEVKSSGNTNSRTERQRSSIKQLHTFYEDDVVENFRGLPSVRRMEMPVPRPSRFGSVMTDCILRSRGTNFHSMSPERGLTYVCLRDSAALNQLGILGPRQILTIINELKIECSWAPYYPFTLSISDSEALYDFIAGRVTLMILLDADIFVQQFAEKGLHAEFLDHDDYAVQVHIAGSSPEADGYSLISRHAFGRLFYEFGSVAELAELESAWCAILKKEFDGLAERIAMGELPPDAQTAHLPVLNRLKWPTPGH